MVYNLLCIIFLGAQRKIKKWECKKNIHEGKMPEECVPLVLVRLNMF